jgi:Zn-dependent protease
MEHSSEELPMWRPVEVEPEPTFTYEPPSPVKEDRGLFKRIGAGIAALGALIAKLGAQLKFALLLLPKAKLFLTAGTMLVSVAAYATIWGWQFAAGFVVLLLIHELGHGLQMKREGIPMTAPIFIPFMGAVIGMKSMPKNAASEARIGLAGPVIGSLACLVPLGLYAATGNNLFRALAFTGFFINLFNLLPVVPLDGGRAMAAISPVVWILGFAALVAAAVLFPNPIIFIIVLFAGLEAWRRFKMRKSPEHQAYHDVSKGTRFAVAAVYLGLALLLVVGMHFTHFQRTFG